MNHHQDIDDGLEEFQSQQARQQAERHYRELRKTFDRTIDGDPFNGGVIEELILTGQKTGEDGTPFDFESGIATVLGFYRGTPHTLTLRWSDNGKTMEESLKLERPWRRGPSTTGTGA